MAKCNYCGTTIILGGVRDGEMRFCNDRCHQQGYLVAVSCDIPDDIVREQVLDIHQGACPQCGGEGPVDVHVSHRIWSALVVTSWSNRPIISCRSCGNRARRESLLFSMLLGWWGFPWGVIFTPVEIMRNIRGMMRPDSAEPSNELEQFVRVQLAAAPDHPSPMPDTPATGPLLPPPTDVTSRRS